MSEIDGLLRELNHRVNNNFQIVVSLMNLKKRLLPVDRQDDIRFIEEHVQSMAVAYRLIYANGVILEVPASDLVADVLLGLRLIAKLAAERIDLDLAGLKGMLNLDQAIALALYLAVVLPPYLDQARLTRGVVSVAAGVDDGILTVTVSGEMAEPVEVDFLRERLMAAYVAQLGATQGLKGNLAQHSISFHIAAAGRPSGAERSHAQ